MYLALIKSNSFFDHHTFDRHEIQPWELYLDKGQIMSIFIVDYDLYYQYWTLHCDTIKKHVPILHCYRLTLEDLQRMN